MGRNKPIHEVTRTNTNNNRQQSEFTQSLYRRGGTDLSTRRVLIFLALTLTTAMTREPHSRLFSLYPLFQLSLAYIAGVLLSNILNTRPQPLIILAGVSSLIALLGILRRWKDAAGLALLLSFLLAGASLASLEREVQPQNGLRQLFDLGCLETEESIILTGVVDEPPEFAREQLYLVVRVETVATQNYNSNTSGTVTLLATFKSATSEQEYRQLNLHYGTRVRVKATVSRRDQYRNPGVSPFTEYLNRKGYDAAGVIKSSSAIVRLEDVEVFSPLQWLYKWRENIQRTIDQQFSTETAGVLDASLLGNRRNLSKTTIDHFRDGGTFHVLVISGLHISFIGGLVLLLARRLTRNRFLQFLLSGGVVWSYSLAVGAEASVVRAALMFTVVAFAALVFRISSALNALGGAGLILLIKSPKDIFDPSLQLTFLSVLAIVAFAWPLLQSFKAIGSWRPSRSTPYPPRCSRSVRALCECLYWSEIAWRAELARTSHSYRLFKTPGAVWLERFHLQRLLRYIFNATIVSITVQIILLPLLIVYFHRISPSSLILNIFVSLLLAILGFVAGVALLLSQLSITLASPFFQLANLINRLMVHSVDPFSLVGIASVRLPEYTGWSVLIYLFYCLPLVTLLTALSRWRPLAGPTAILSRPGAIWVACLFQMVFLLLVLLHPFSAGRPDGLLRVDFLDVGQGDAALVTMPDGTTLLVDGGGRPRFNNTKTEGNPYGNGDSFERTAPGIGEMVVAEHLWWRGLDSIDYVLATHADADHIDGLNDVVRNFSVRGALVGRTPSADVEYSRFVQTLITTKTHVERIWAGDQLQFGGVEVSVLWPGASSDESAPSGNNDSVVLRFKYGENTILLTGDIEKEAEAQLLAANVNLHADVVKVPHHGSRTSSTLPFIKATSPRYAIISVGQKSMFGHPHAEVVERWTLSGAQVLTTGDSGMISITSDSKTISIKKFGRN